MLLIGTLVVGAMYFAMTIPAPNETNKRTLVRVLLSLVVGFVVTAGLMGLGAFSGPVDIHEPHM